MRKLFLLIVAITAFVFSSLAQGVTITTYGKKMYDWDDKKKEWIFTSEDEKFASLFEFNDKGTMLKHTISEMQSTYYVKNSKPTKDKDIFEFELVSDVGNKYTMIVDYKNMSVRFICKASDGGWYLLRYAIKKAWVEES